MIDICLAVLCAFIIALWVANMNAQQAAIKHEREQWHKERQQLLDRIQAPSFSHFKEAEVKVIKAQREEKSEEPLELV